MEHHESESREPDTRRKLRMLLLDGGGAKGVVPLAILNRLLNKHEDIGRPYEPAYRLFDIIVGTSIGGIIGVMLAYNLHPEDLMDRIVDLSSVVLKERHPGLTESLFGLYTTPNLYNHRTLRDKLRETLKAGGRSNPEAFEHLFTSAYVVTTELHRPGRCRRLFGRPQGFSLLFGQRARIIGRPLNPTHPDDRVEPDRNQEDELVGGDILNNTLLIDAMRCSSAAPTFFKSVWDGGNRRSRYIDGGVGNNHPGMVALAPDFLDIGRDVQAVVVSIGCGFKHDTSPFWNVAGRIKSWYTDTERINGRTQEFCRRRGFSYFRFNPSFEEHDELQDLKLNCYKEKVLEKAVEVTREWCDTDRIAAELRDARHAL